MRIWVLSSELPWGETGGIGRYCLNYALSLRTAGHDVTLIGFSEQDKPRSFPENVQTITLRPQDQTLDLKQPSGLSQPPAHSFLSAMPARSLQMADEVIKLLQTNAPPEIIESQEFHGLPYYLLQKKLTGNRLLRDIPILVHLHSPLYELKSLNQQPRYSFPDYWVGQMEKFSILAADALLSPSQFLADAVCHSLDRQLPITCIPYPASIPQDTATESPRPELVYLGRLELRKGILPLIKECSLLWAEGLNFQLTLIGRDTSYVPLNTTVGTYIKKRYGRWLKNGNLVIAEEMEHHAAQLKMRQAWGAIIPSLWENFPNTCIEAMAAGQLVVVSKQGGQAEMVKADGENGIIFDWNIKGDLSRQLRRALSLSSNERAAIAENARIRISSYCHPESVAKLRIAHYKQVIQQHKAPRIFPSVNHPLEQVHSLAVIPQVEKGLLSVIVPFYNLGRYVDEAIRSIQNSDYRSVEIIVVNDGSTDEESLSTLKRIEKECLANLRIIHTENQGLALTRNAGANAARGEFLCFVDADDTVEPSFFSQAIHVLQSYDNVAFVTSWVQLFEESNGIWPTWNTELPYLLGHNMLTACAVIKRAWFEYAGHNNPILEYSLEDYGMWLGIVLKGGLGVSLPAPLIRYRIRTGSMSHRENRNERLYLYERIAELYPEAYREWGKELLHPQNANGPAALWSTPVQQSVSAAGLEPFQHLGVTSSDLSLRFAAKLIHQMRRNKLFKGLLRTSPAYLQLKRMARKLIK